MDIAGQLISFDRHVALDRVGGDEELLREVVELYLQEYPALLGEIAGAVDNGDAGRLERSAHTLKGSLGTLGAEAAGKLALALEAMGRQKNLDGAREGQQALEAALERLSGELAVLSR